MLILGDVFAIAMSLLGAGITAWALVMAGALLFPSRASRADDAVVRSPLKSVLGGLVGLLVFGSLGLALLGRPLPGAKLLGLFMLLALLAVAFMGLSGIALAMARRLRALDSSLTTYGAWARSAAILVAAGFFPFLGWFFVAPALLAAGLGCGTSALVGRATAETVEGS